MLPERGDEIVGELDRNERAARTRVLRRWVWVFGTLFVVISIGLVAFALVVLRDKPANACEQLLSPLADIEQLVGFPLRFEGGIGGDRDCELYVWERDVARAKIGSPIVIVKNQHAVRFDTLRRELADQKFTATERFAIATGDATLFVAGEPQPTVDDVSADVAARAAKPRAGADPMAAALAAMPPAHHAALFVHGDTLTELQLEQRAFTPERAKALVTTIAKRVAR